MFNKVSKISAAVAATLFSSAALAIDPSVIPDIEVWMSGAPGQDSAIAEVFSEMCVTTGTGTLDVYTGGSTAAGTNHSAYYCEIDVTQAVDGFAVGGAGMTTWIAANQGVNPKVLLHKSSGGSGYGVNPLVTPPLPTPIAMVINNVSSGTNNCLETLPASRLWACNISGATYTPADAGNPTAAELANPTLNTMYIKPDAGVSYVNPELFTNANTPRDYLGYFRNPDIEVKSVTGLVFGIPVSLPLYRALQLVQGKNSTDPLVYDNEANMPSLSKAEVASIMAGRVNNWDKLKAGPNADQGLYTYYTTPVLSGGLGGPAPFNNLVNICSRANGSGTKAQMSAIFLHYPCTVGGGAPTAVYNNFTGPRTFLNPSSGNVDTCLNTAGTLGGVMGTSATPGSNRWAIGVQALINNFLVDTDDDTIPDSYPLNYRFVKIGGVAPTLANAANGKYLDWVTTSMQWHKSGSDALHGYKRDLVTMIAAGVGRASTVRDVLNPPLVYGFGQSGYLALDTNGTNAPSYPFSVTNPVTPYTHTIGGGLDNCRSPVLLDTAGM